jgi:two-component system OmpR family response regulator
VKQRSIQPDAAEGKAKAMRILLIEDDQETLDFVASGLGRDGHLVETCQRADDALAVVTSTAPFDVIVVDRMLPDRDGLQLVKAIRALEIGTPILFLTTMVGVNERVRGLQAGGDDYLVKPFAFAELRARLQALARRPPLQAEVTVLRVAELEMDLVRRVVVRAGRRINLLPKEFQLLEYLMRNAGRVVTRTMFLENVWQFNFDPRTSVVETHISRLRSKIDRGFAYEILRTIHGVGYCLKLNSDDTSPKIQSDHNQV